MSNFCRPLPVPLPISLPVLLATSIGGTLGVLALPHIAQAQNTITPDTTLGIENSQINSINATTDVIEGGAIREANLFHSFQDFSVGEGLQVYFANPDGIDHIFSRVTGNNPSTILGTLGVEGPADLFFFNPEGIIFGASAQLDVEGAFLATTAENIVFSDGNTFSTNSFSNSPVLSIGVPLGIQYGPGTFNTIESAGSLTAGGDLTLAAGTLALQGELSAGQALSLLAEDSLIIQDSADDAFVATAGEQLLLRGDRRLSLAALDNVDSGLFSGGDMVLTSEVIVTGNPQYQSGGDFQIERLDGSAGNIEAPAGLVLRALGNVDINEYEGASLHILAGGAVRLNSTFVTEPTQNTLGGTVLQETVTLSDGTVVAVDGTAQSTLDVRAGIAPSAIGLSRVDSSTPIQPSEATIEINRVLTETPGGLVLLTNQYEGNPEISRGDIVLLGDDIDASGEFFGIDTGADGTKGGDVFLDARDDISVIDTIITTGSLRDSGDIVLLAEDTIRMDGLAQDAPLGGAFSGIVLGGQGLIFDGFDLVDDGSPQQPGNAGDIRVVANNLEARNGAQLNSDNWVGSGQAGNITVEVADTVSFEGVGFFEPGVDPSLLEDLFNVGEFGNVSILENPFTQSGVSSSVRGFGRGRGGNIQITADNLEVIEGAAITTETNLGVGNAGDVVLDIEETIRVDGLANGGNGLSVPSQITSSIGTGEGTGGNLKFSSTTLEVLNGGLVRAEVTGVGEAGNITIRATESVALDGSVIGRTLFNDVPFPFSSAITTTTITSNADNKGGDIAITANSLDVTNGAVIVASTAGAGDAGNIRLDIVETALFDGVLFDDVSRVTFASGASANSALGATGAGGDIQLSATNLTVSNGGSLNVSTILGTGDAGDIDLDIKETARIDGFTEIPEFTVEALGIFEPNTIRPFDNSRFILPSNVSSDLNFAGEAIGGNVNITANNLEINNQARVTASALLGRGNAGSIRLSIGEQLTATDGNILTLTNLTSGGQISIDADAVLLDGNSNIATLVNQGQGRGGNINITADAVVAFDDSDILSFSEDGQGGDIALNTPAFFGENYQPVPDDIDPFTLEGNGRVDVNARGQISGEITLPDVSFIQDELAELPDNIVNPGQLIAGSCIAQRGSSGSFVVAGGGGLPARPGNEAIAPYAIGDIRLLGALAGTHSPNSQPASTSIVEPQGIFQLADGRVVMGRQCGG